MGQQYIHTYYMMRYNVKVSVKIPNDAISDSMPARMHLGKDIDIAQWAIL